MNESTDLFKRKLYKAGELLFKEGEPASHFFIVSSGRVALVKNRGGRKTVFQVCEDKDMAGEDCVFCKNKIYDHSAVILENSEVFSIAAEEALKVVNGKSSWIQNIFEDLSKKLTKTSELLAAHRIEDEKLYGKKGFDEEDLALVNKTLS